MAGRKILMAAVVSFGRGRFLQSASVRITAAMLLILGAWAASWTNCPRAAMEQPTTSSGRIIATPSSHPRETPSAFNAFLRSSQMPPGNPGAFNGILYLIQSLEADNAEKVDVENLAYSILMLVKFDRTGQYRFLADSAAVRLRSAQFTEARGYDPTHRYYGGTGADPHAEPDMIHTALAVRALRMAGDNEQATSIRQAVEFISRCQHINAGGEAANPSIEGGFSEKPVASILDVHRTTLWPANGASTCSALNGLIVSGVSPEDPRIQAALRWLARHYTLEAHPGMANPRRGLYRYYHEFAQAMHVLGMRHLRDDHGVDHDWRAELADRLVPSQCRDGSWINADESEIASDCHPVVVTSYAVFALSEILASADVEDEISCAIRDAIESRNR